MEAPDTKPERWTPPLVATLILRLVAAMCIVFGAFWLIDWVSYRVQYSDVVGTTVTQDVAYAMTALRYLLVGGLLLLFEPMFVRWLLGGRLGSGADASTIPFQDASDAEDPDKPAS
ncbi:MAG: hypothetical protein ACIAQU_08070 [Phycisphaerales bacterium JB064]